MTLREAAELFGIVCLYGGLFGLAVLAIGVFAVGFGYVFRVVKREFRSVGNASRAVALAAVVLATMYGGSKSTARVEINDPYITDAGSYVTNEYVHVAISARFDFIQPTTEVLIFSRELAQTNAEDWVQLVRAEEGPYRLLEFPLDIPFPNATNYNFLVAANYIPEPTVHTNGVWQVKGFIVPGTETESQSGVYAFPNTKTKLEK